MGYGRVDKEYIGMGSRSRSPEISIGKMFASFTDFAHFHSVAREPKLVPIQFDLWTWLMLFFRSNVLIDQARSSCACRIVSTRETRWC